MITFRDSSSFVRYYNFNLFCHECRIVIESVIVTQKIEILALDNTSSCVLKPNKFII